MTVPADRKTRFEWIDSARGIGIILVVYGHVIRGLVTNGSLVSTGAVAVQDSLIYAFHMPLFFVLSGATFERSVKRDASAFAADKWWTLAYPYLLWSLIHVAIAVALGGSVNNPKHWTDLAGILMVPLFHFWFLAALLVCQLMGLAIKVSRVAVAIIAAACLFLPTPFPGTNLGNGVSSFPFFALGLLLAPWAGRLPELRRTAVALSLAAALGAFVVLFLTISGDQGRVAAFPLAVSGIAATVFLCVLIDRRLPWLQLVGRASMAIFILHIIVSSGLRIVISALGLSPDMFLLVPVLTIAGTIAPMAIGLWASRLGLSQKLGLGKPFSV